MQPCTFTTNVALCTTLLFKLMENEQEISKGHNFGSIIATEMLR